MDDGNKMTENVKAAQEANDKIEDLLESKLLDLNLDKSNFILIGSKKARKNLHQQITNNPLILCNNPMKEVKLLKFLGDYLSFSLEDSVHQTVMKRLGVAKQAIFEIRAVIEDRRASTIGGINIAFKIWEASVLTMLAFNSETWISIPQKKQLKC